MGTLVVNGYISLFATCKQYKIYQENFPPTQINLCYKVWNHLNHFESIWLTFLPTVQLKIDLRLEHFSMASLDCPYQVDDFRVLKRLNPTFLAWDMRLKWLKCLKIVKMKKKFSSLSLHWLNDGHKIFSIFTSLAKVIKWKS